MNRLTGLRGLQQETAADVHADVTRVLSGAVTAQDEQQVAGLQLVGAGEGVPTRGSRQAAAIQALLEWEAVQPNDGHREHDQTRA